MAQEQSAIAQASVAGGLLAIYAVRKVLPTGPQWCRSFAKEEPWQAVGGRPATRYPLSTLALLSVSSAGLVLTIKSAVDSPNHFWKWLELAPWAAALVIAVVERPRKTPKTMLALLITAVVGGLVSLGAALNKPGHASIIYANIIQANILHLGKLLLALVGILVILFMPIRDPVMASYAISRPHDAPTSDLRSPEDNLTLWQFLTVSWMVPLIRVGSSKQLSDDKVWQLPHDFQHDRLLTLFREIRGSLIRRLVHANGFDLFIITFLGLLESAATLLSPVLLRNLLRAATRREEDQGAVADAVKYAVAILVVRLVACQSQVLNLWFSRRAYERARGELITTIYAKTLTRKFQGFQPGEKDPANVNGLALNGGDLPEQTRFSLLLTRLGLRKRKQQTVAQAEAPATMGKVLNLMRSDCYEVAQRFWDFPQFITKPLQFALSLVLLWFLLGWPCLLGVAWVAVVQLVNAGFVRQLIRRERLRRAATDARLQATSQFVEAIRHLRWYDWQSKWLGKIMSARDQELRLRVITGIWTIAIGTLNLSAGAIFPVVSFAAYTYLAHRPLPVDVIFSALQLFQLLETSLKELPALIAVLLNASVAMGRLESFMHEPDKEEVGYSDTVSDIEFRDASLAWPGSHKLVLDSVNLKFSQGLTVVCGKVGAGKTALLQAILGELDKRGGNYSIPNEIVGYCAQQPWLQHMSIRDNILFSAPYDPVRYRQVLDACALTPDLANLKHGDLSNIGENGIGLSGGQKARVALARAVYSQSRILLLDDPLAPLDHNTAESIVQKLLAGPLVEERIVVLVTHRVDLCMHMADQVVEIEDGRARVLGTDEIPRQIAKEASNLGNAATEQPQAATEEEEDAAIPDKFIEDEHMATGGVVARVYWTYIRAGKLKLWMLLVVIFGVLRLVRLFNSWFLKAWGEAYPQAEDGMFRVLGSGLGSFGSGLFDSLPRPDEDVAPWLMLYLYIALAMSALLLLSQGALLLILYMAAKNLFVRVLNKVSNATFRFYDVTPVGRLMNRLTSDIGMLDGGIVSPLQDFAFYVIVWLSSMVVIAITTPVFFLFALVMSGGFVFIFRQYLPTSQSLRRLEFVSLTPLMSNFGILVDGLTTIRAYKAQASFQHRNIVVVDAFQKMDHFYWSLQAWLMYRFDAISAFSTFALTMMALQNGLSAGLIAFVINTASQFVEATHSLCKVYGTLQMDFVSVERVVELLDLEEEPSGSLQPALSWPSPGDDITFDNVTMKYAPHLEPSLMDVSFTIPGGATCAVLGRTGSGKSTLALALLATLRPERGSITVGGIDVSNVDVHAWRQRISFVAQDPVLFPGTLRQNLDPMEEHSDAECAAVLRRVLGPDEWGLGSHVDGGGKNMSQGQRQLVGIGRAVLRRSPVVVLDEATASIDKATAAVVQDVLRDELRTSTVITIAHRLEAVKDADYFIRLDKGRVVEAGPAKGQ